MASPTTPTETPAPAPKPEPAAAKAASPFAFIGAMLILTGLGVGAGGLFGLQVLAKAEKPAAAKAEAHASQPVRGRYAGNVTLRPLSPIVTNIAAPGHIWIRLEGLLVAEGEQAGEANALAATIAEDIVAYLRTVTLAQIQGATGFQNLREDLNERVRVRSGGKVRDLVIQSMVVE